MNTTIILAGASVRAAAMSARRAGWSPVGYDLFCDEDLRACGPCRQVEPSRHTLLDLVVQGPAGPWMFTGALENEPDLVDTLAGVRTLYGNAGKTLRQVRDPFRLTYVLSRAGYAMPAMRGSPRGLPRDGRWLRKKFRSAGGCGILPHRDLAVSAAAAAVYYQQRVAGECWGANFVAAEGDALLLGVSKQLGVPPHARPDDFRYAGSIGPLSLNAAEQIRLLRLGKLLAREFSLVGLFGVDFVRSGDCWWVLEVNPRYTASVEILERAIGFYAVHLHITACRDGRLTHRPLPAARCLAGKQIIYAQHDVVIGGAFQQTVAQENSLTPYWPAVADLPAPGTTISNGQPVVTVFAEGASIVQIEDELARLAARIERALYD